MNEQTASFIVRARMRLELREVSVGGANVDPAGCGVSLVPRRLGTRLDVGCTRAPRHACERDSLSIVPHATLLTDRGQTLHTMVRTYLHS